MRETPPPPALASDKKTLPVVSRLDNDEAMSIPDMARTTQIALDNIAAPREFNAIPDKIASLKGSENIADGLKNVIDTLNSWRGENKEKTSDPLYLTMYRIERLIEKQVRLHESSNKAELRMLEAESEQSDALDEIKKASDEQAGIWQKILDKAKKEEERQGKKFEGKNESANDNADSGMYSESSSRRGLISRLKDSATSDLKYYMGPVMGMAKAMGLAGIAALGILASAKDIIEGWVGAERAGVGKATSMIGSILGGQSIPLQLFKGYLGWKIGAKAGVTVGGFLGSLAGPGGTLIGSIAGGIIGVSLGLTSSILATHLGPERMTAMVKRLWDGTKRMVDNMFGTTFIIDEKAIEEERKTLETAIEKVRTHLADSSTKLKELMHQRVDLLQRMNKGALSPEEQRKFATLLKDIDEKVKAEKDRSDALNDQLKSHIERLEQARKDQMTVHTREREDMLKTFRENGIKLEGEAKKMYENLIKDQERRIAQMTEEVKAAVNTSEDEEWKREMLKRLEQTKKKARSGFFGAIMDWIEGDIDQMAMEPKVGSVKRGSMRVREIEQRNRLLEEQKKQETPPQTMENVHKMSDAASRQLPPMTARLLKTQNVVEDMKQTASRPVSAQPIVVANAPTNNVSMKNSSTSIYAKVDPRGQVDPVMRRSAFGYA